MSSPLYLGCAMWANADWRGSLFAENAQNKDFLAAYSQVFNTAEGNTTFYGLPSAATAERWRQDSAESFRFCFKFPRDISHQGALSVDNPLLVDFLAMLERLKGRVGPSFLQLPASYAPSQTQELLQFLDCLPQGRWAVELRHPDFFAKGEAEKRLNRALFERGIDRVMLDSRPLFSATDGSESTRHAQSKKPRLPVRVMALGRHPMVRFIGHPELDANRSWMQQWAAKVVEWISEDRQPYVFLHTPDNRLAPQLVRIFHQMVCEQGVELPPLLEKPKTATADESIEQISMF